MATATVIDRERGAYRLNPPLPFQFWNGFLEEAVSATSNRVRVDGDRVIDIDDHGHDEHDGEIVRIFLGDLNASEIVRSPGYTIT